jgi:hypothetical protein
MKKEKTMNPALKLAVFFTLAMGAGDVLAEPPAIAPHPTTVEACPSNPEVHVFLGALPKMTSCRELSIVPPTGSCASVVTVRVDTTPFARIKHYQFATALRSLR